MQSKCQLPLTIIFVFLAISYNCFIWIPLTLCVWLCLQFTFHFSKQLSFDCCSTTLAMFYSLISANLLVISLVEHFISVCMCCMHDSAKYSLYYGIAWTHNKTGALNSIPLPIRYILHMMPAEVWPMALGKYLKEKEQNDCIFFKTKRIIHKLAALLIKLSWWKARIITNIVARRIWECIIDRHL